MKLFLDTSNKKIVLAIINNDDLIVDFFIKDSNKELVKNTLPLIKKILVKNNLKINNFDEFFLTKGPGSFTGVKVALNIIKSINLVQKINKIHTIDTFDLLLQKEKKYTAIKFGKNKFYIKYKNKIKIVNNIDNIDINNITIDYKEFDQQKLQEKINSNKFKVLNNIDKVILKYHTNFRRIYGNKRNI